MSFSEESPCFLSLAEDILRDITQDWLDFQDLCNLDTAVCVHSNGARDAFLELLSSERKTVLGYHARVPPIIAFPWITARRIKLHSLDVSDCEEEEDWAALRSLALDGLCIDRLQSLKVRSEESCHDADLTMLLLRSCKTLKRLDFIAHENVFYSENYLKKVVPYIARSVLLESSSPFFTAVNNALYVFPSDHIDARSFVCSILGICLKEH